MELDLVYTDASHVPQGSLSGAVLDLAFGDDENDFELTLPDRYHLEPGCWFGAVGTEYGGIVDEQVTESDGSTCTWRGRTWHGAMCFKVVQPDAGSSHLTVSGDANNIISMLVQRCALAGFRASSDLSGVNVANYSFERYTDLYSGLRAMLAASGARLSTVWDGEAVILSAVPVTTASVDTDRYPVMIDAVHRSVNHLVCLGSGEMAERIVLHLYADAAGNVSQTQSLFGLDEVALTYDYSAADAETLLEKGTERLREYQNVSSTTLPELESLGDLLHIGDAVVAYDPRMDVTVSSKVTEKIVRYDEDGLTVSYETGDTVRSSGNTVSGGSSGGGSVIYSAGEGISIVSGVISAEVTQAELDAVSTAASNAQTTASNASAAAASAASAASAAQATANSAASAAATAQATADAACPYIVGTQTESTSAWTGVAPFATLKEGQGIRYYLPYAGKSDAATLQLTLSDGTQTEPIPLRRTATSTVTTHFGAGNVISMTYDGSYWKVDAYYDSNTIGYQLRTNSTVRKVSDTARYYKLYFTSADDTMWVPASVNSTNNATAARAVNQRPIDPFGPIVYTSASTNYAAGANLAAATIWEQYVVTLGYSFNRTGKALTLTAGSPVYVKCASQADGSVVMDADEPYVQALPGTNDGKVYIYLGIATSATQVELQIWHPVYWHDGTAIRLWTGAETVTQADLDTRLDGYLLEADYITPSWITANLN